MLQLDAGERDYAAGNHARGVVAPADAGLRHQGLHTVGREMAERNRGEHFESAHAVAWVATRVATLVLVLPVQRGRAFAGQVFVGDGLAINADSFVEAPEMGRSVQAGADAEALQNGGGDGAGAAFAFASGYLDGIEFGEPRRGQGRGEVQHAMQADAVSEFREIGEAG